MPCTAARRKQWRLANTWDSKAFGWLRLWQALSLSRFDPIGNGDLSSIAQALHALVPLPQHAQAYGLKARRMADVLLELRYGLHDGGTDPIGQFALCGWCEAEALLAPRKFAWQGRNGAAAAVVVPALCCRLCRNLNQTEVSHYRSMYRGRA